MERAIIYCAKTGLEATDHFVPELLEKYCKDNGYEIVATINEMPDMASYHADLNDTIEKRQQKFIRKVGNPYMMRVGKMKVKVSFANNGVSIEEAFKNMLLTV